jgi:pyruvate formate lyase activating enzyme
VPSVEPIFESLKEMKRQDIHVEVTNLVVPKTGDSIERIGDLAGWICKNLGEDTPFHLLRFHPDYNMVNIASTEINTLEKAYSVSQEVGLSFVYLGNVPGHRFENEVFALLKDCP